MSPSLFKWEKESYHMALPRPEHVWDTLLYHTDLHQSQTSSTSHRDSRLPFAAVGSAGHFASMGFTTLSSQVGGDETWQCWCLCQGQKELFLCVWLWLQPLIHQSYFPPFPSPVFPSSNLSFPLPIPLPSLTSPESSQSSSISASLSQSVCQFSPGPLNHQVALQPHAPFSWCLASPTAPLPPVHHWHAAGRSDSQRTDSLLSVYVRTYSRHSSLDLTLQEKNPCSEQMRNLSNKNKLQVSESL